MTGTIIALIILAACGLAWYAYTRDEGSNSGGPKPKSGGGPGEEQDGGGP